MARYRGAKLRVTRRLGDLPAFTSKKSNSTQRPGQHGATPKKLTQYAMRLEEKQKLRFNYGLSEKQLMNYIKEAKRIKGATGNVLLQLLEMRLDNIVFRLGMAPTIVAARQLVSHGHILINGSLLDIPSYICQPKDVISVKQNKASKKLVETFMETISGELIPEHLSLNQATLSGEVKSIVQRNWISLKINELLVIEYYSRKV